MLLPMSLLARPQPTQHRLLPLLHTVPSKGGFGDLHVFMFSVVYIGIGAVPIIGKPYDNVY